MLPPARRSEVDPIVVCSNHPLETVDCKSRAPASKSCPRIGNAIAPESGLRPWIPLTAARVAGVVDAIDDDSIGGGKPRRLAKPNPDAQLLSHSLRHRVRLVAIVQCDDAGVV